MDFLPGSASCPLFSGLFPLLRIFLDGFLPTVYNVNIILI